MGTSEREIERNWIFFMSIPGIAKLDVPGALLIFFSSLVNQGGYSKSTRRDVRLARKA